MAKKTTVLTVRLMARSLTFADNILPTSTNVLIYIHEE